MKTIFNIGWSFIFINITVAQDALFTQFYAIPQQTNAALVGTTPHYRASLLYRNQWSAIPQNYETSVFSYDYNLRNKGGWGVQLLNERIHTLGLHHNYLSAAYTYNAYLNRKWIFKPALQVGANYRNFSFSKLTFADQIEHGGATAERPQMAHQFYLTIGAGFLLYNKKWILGLGTYHLNRPKEGEPTYYQSSQLAPRFTLQGAHKMVLSKTKKETKSITPALLYQYQAGFQQADMGANLFLSPLMIGLWYRGLPLLGSPIRNVLNQDAIAVLVGLRYDYFRITYSYDKTISRLIGSGGSHEISISIEPFADFRPRRKRDLHYIECPLFMNF
ncbi:MAG: PorP/SprF family type IX secretion system membrane protein [Cytophagales bacterium]|nr:PorP/SprF family type IX secretion system membrane protein [Cytophagales bacterium]MDW8383469.1 PorP/SprF family type IX secretion system membrane protein [Flammeovirgaceae bacterium]